MSNDDRVGAQLDLFAPRAGLVRHDHPDTSRAAAQLVLPRTGTQRRKVLDAIIGKGELGATDPELQMALAMSGDSERPRRVELVEAEMIVDSGGRRDGCIVWVAAPAVTA